MKHQFLQFLFLLISFQSIAQITGNITNNKNEPLASVNIYLKNTFTGTTSNNEGRYELNINTPNTYTIVFKYLGYKTVKKTLAIQSFPYLLDVVLEEESVSLNEVIVNAEKNPANNIISKAIENRKLHLSKYDEFTANFYSRGLSKIKNAPEKILGQDIGDLGGGLDSTRSGIIYLSETISKIEYKKPNKLKETIIASKISGDDNGFSFNNASEVNFNFYNNTIKIENQLISPISDYAFNYYKYKLEGDFYDDNGNLINKIKVIPKRKKDRVFSGYIYIIEDDWSFYALDLNLTGQQVQIPIADSIKLKQMFSYSKTNNIWALMSQAIDFKYSILGFKGDIKFTSVYSDYNFKPQFDKKSFTKELLSFKNEANKKDSTYWETIRPIPLSTEEISDYIKKDSLQVIRKSKTFLDSIDNKKNKFKLTSLIAGYNYSNSYKDWQVGVSAPLLTFTYNTVQGHNGNLNFNFRKNYDDHRKYLSVKLKTNYGISDERFRINGSIDYKFDDISKPILSISGGNTVSQFNNENPISKRINSFSTLFFEDNYMKLYEKSFGEIDYSQELFNGFRLFTNLSYEHRKPLYNTSNWSVTDEPDDFLTSNNPLDETAFGVATFSPHTIYKLNIASRIRFGQSYFSYPKSKSIIVNNNYPTIYLNYFIGIGASNSDYNFNHLEARLTQNFDIGNKGKFKYNLKVGDFFNANDIAFIDYHHFNGNQTHITEGSYLNKFNNLPYYTMSTNKSYLEMHAEHDFKGFIMNKIPLINKLNFNLVLGFHGLSTETQKPYQEFTIGLNNIGWGKFRFLRVDYLRSYQSGFVDNAVIFGVSF